MHVFHHIYIYIYICIYSFIYIVYTHISVYIYICINTYPNMSFIHVQICESNMICPQSDLELKSECPKPSLGTRIFLDFVDSTRRLEESLLGPIFSAVQVGGNEKQKRSTSRPVEGCSRERLEEWEDL